VSTQADPQRLRHGPTDWRCPCSKSARSPSGGFGVLAMRGYSPDRRHFNAEKFRCRVGLTLCWPFTDHVQGAPDVPPALGHAFQPSRCSLQSLWGDPVYRHSRHIIYGHMGIGPKIVSENEIQPRKPERTARTRDQGKDRKGDPDQADPGHHADGRLRRDGARSKAPGDHPFQKRQRAVSRKTVGPRDGSDLGSIARKPRGVSAHFGSSEEWSGRRICEAGI